MFQFHRRINVEQERLTLNLGDHVRLLHFGTTLPPLGAGWEVEATLSFFDGNCLLLLRNQTQTALWLCDAHNRLISGDDSRTADYLEARLIETPIDADRHILSEVLAVCYLNMGNSESFFETLLASDLFGDVYGSHTLFILAHIALQLGRIDELEAVFGKSQAPSDVKTALLQAYLGRQAADRGDFAAGHAYLALAFASEVPLPDWAAAFLDHCAIYDRSPVCDWVPSVLRAEIGSFSKVIKAFFRGEPAAFEKGRYPLATLACHWVKQFRVVRTAEDQKTLIETAKSCGLSSKFISALCDGPNGVGHAMQSSLPQLPHLSYDYSFRIRDIACGIKAGGKPVLCPFSGSVQFCKDTLDEHVFLHRHDGHIVVIMSERTINYAPSDQIWVFPDSEVLITSEIRPKGDFEFTRTLVRVVQHFEAVQNYLKTPERTVMLAESAMGHIGHYIWNIISGWSPLFEMVDFESVDIITTYNNCHFFGGVSALYQKECERAGQVVKIDTDLDLFRLMLDHKSTLYSVRNCHVSEDLAGRIVRFCETQVTEGFKESLRHFCDSHAPILMITLRTGNRSWETQTEGYIQIINALAQHYPNLRVIIDGLNAAADGTSTALPMSVQDEEAIAASIIAGCPTVQIWNSIGCSIFESLLLCCHCDAFIAPIGAGLAKVRWIANKPGLGFSNRTFLAPDHLNGYLYSFFRENQIPMRYISREHIRDMDDGPSGMKDRANFDVDWTVIYDEIRHIVENIRDARLALSKF